jgi:hypothetical protein
MANQLTDEKTPKSAMHVYDALKGDAERSIEFYKWIALGLGGYASLVIAVIATSAQAVLSLSIAGKLSIGLGLVCLGLGVHHAASNAFLNIARLMKYDLAIVGLKHSDAKVDPPNFDELNSTMRTMTKLDKALHSAFLLATAFFFFGFTDLLGLFES